MRNKLNTNGIGIVVAYFAIVAIIWAIGIAFLVGIGFLVVQFVKWAWSV